ncbi:MAG TPA: DNA replication/repair protein RecF [Geoalkalibacter subterraneus]|uniref:DNA replication and repair protein RecF n=1 Tax=Geoalkalibacter subterraneus TaxID=483547 RepID=A0A831LTC2_9BACT|nr:DNA replication/repair protein RecF [Geoalkalibacter subterraneus]
MLISALKYLNFRNIAAQELAPSQGFNVFWGQNAQGKTNLLEGIYLLGTLKSFRSSRIEDLLQFETDRARLSAKITTARVERHLSLILEAQGKKIELDGKAVRKATDVLGTLRPVLFSPEEVALVKGPPGGRRDLIDRALLQADSSYLQRFNEFLRILHHRNQLLKEDAAERILAPWNESYLQAAARICADRYAYIEAIRPGLQAAYAYIAQNGECADLHCRAPSNGDFYDDLKQTLQRSRSTEQRLGQTQVGPHRDDPGFMVDGRPLRIFGSQGQQRCFILAFKASQIAHLEREAGEPPVLLLDDITSELDAHRKNYLFEFLRERRGQVFLTTTDPEALCREGLEPARFYHVKKGQLHHE